MFVLGYGVGAFVVLFFVDVFCLVWGWFDVVLVEVIAISIFELVVTILAFMLRLDDSKRQQM